jgi:hypothetical protein
MTENINSLSTPERLDAAKFDRVRTRGASPQAPAESVDLSLFA